jgi:iron(III) transport system substrate-binding protein
MNRKPLSLFISALILLCTVNAAFGEKQAVVYTALDQIFSEPILKDFETETGISVKAVYDIEAVKTTGLVNRLIAEKRRPQCDVFWNNEIIRTIVLKRKGVLAPYRSPSAADIPNTFKDKDGYWTGFAARARVLVVNTKLVDNTEMPQSIFDLTQPRFKAKAAIANPLFGTTATHVAALFTVLGKAKAEAFFLNLKNNQIQVVDGNSVVKDQVGTGTLMLGFTDTDDVSVGVAAGMPITPVFPDKKDMGTLVIPNTVSLVANCPHPEEARQLIDYLLTRGVESKLSFSKSVQMPVRPGVKTPQGLMTIDQIKAMEVDFEQVADLLDPSVKYIQNVLIR